MTSHEETDEVRRSFAELLARAETGQWEEFQAGCARLQVMTAHLRQMERARWYNILCAPVGAASSDAPRGRSFYPNGLYIP